MNRKLPEFADWEKVWKKLLTRELPHTHRPVHRHTKISVYPQAAVLILWDRSADPHVLVTKRSQELRTHAGEMAFPGGMKHPEDLTLEETALRELHEETGIAADSVEILGALPPLVTLSEVCVTPFLALGHQMYPSIELQLCDREVEDAYWFALSQLRDPSAFSQKKIRVGSYHYQTPIFKVHGEVVWGATAAILKNLLDRFSSFE